MGFSINDITKEDVERAFEYINKNKVPFHNEAKRYFVISSRSGKEYPVRYTIAVALYLKTNDPNYRIDTFIKDSFNSITAKNRLKALGFPVRENANNANDGGRETMTMNYVKDLLNSKNLIFHGAPGTGKTYLARQIAADIVSGGTASDYNELNDEQKERIGFVQFHPSYDYTDFVEGLRPVDKGNGTIGFELRDGVFKSFVERAVKDEAKKKYVFIIDEINRGEIAKIFGELFFSIDPGYRGKAGEILTQYANMHENPNERFYIPENVYIIGTMNDIDRSVDTFDFAMRRRFRFIELKADECAAMLNSLEDKKDEAKGRMKRLNEAIKSTPGLGEDYQIGPAYFLKADEVGSDKLYKDHLEPLLREYVRGMDGEEALMKKFNEAYDDKPQQAESAENKSADEDTENQG